MVVKAMVVVLAIKEASVEVLVVQEALVAVLAIKEASAEVLAIKEALVVKVLVVEALVVAMAHHMDMVFKMIWKDHSSSSMIKFIMMNIEEIY